MTASASLIVGKVRRYLDTFGWKQTIQKIAGQVFVAPFFQRTRYRVYRADVTLPTALDHSQGDVALMLLDPNDGDSVRLVEHHAEWLQGRLANLLEDHAMCVVARRGTHVVGFNIVLFGEVSIGVIRWRRRFRPWQAWSEHLWVDKQCRGQGLATQVRFHVFDQLRSWASKHSMAGRYGPTGRR